MKTITVSAFKGGVGKTMLATLLGVTYASSGYRVLCIDLDHQKNLSQYHVMDWDAARRKNIAEVFYGNSINENLLPSQIIGIQILAGSFKILKYRGASNRTLQRALSEIETEFDVCIIDTPPSLDTFSLNAWYAADTIVTPARSDSYDLEGLEIMRTEIIQELPEKIDDWKIVLNFYRPPRVNNNNSLNFQFFQAFEDSYPNIFNIKIPEASAIFRSIHNGEILSEARGKERAYKAIIGLASELIGKEVRPQGGKI